jgi:hypothetical protein
MPTNPTPSAGRNTPPASNSTSPPTQLATVLTAATAAFATQENLRHALQELKTSLHDSRQSGAHANRQIMVMLKALGDQSARAVESAAASAAKFNRLDCAFDSQLGEVARLGNRIGALQQSLAQSWLQRQLASLRMTWATICQDTRGISREEWTAAKRMLLRGARANRWLWRGTMVLLLLVLMLVLAIQLT